VSEVYKAQVMFARLVPRLIDRAFYLGLDATIGEAWRTPEQAKWNAKHGKGISNSLHLERLAIDLNLFRKGVWLQDSSDHHELGQYWKSLDPRCAWGGDFKPPTPVDGNHYSLAFGGRK
jgi:hypothetical protein